MSSVHFRSIRISLLTGVILLAGFARDAVADVLAYAELSNTTFGVQDLSTGVFTQLGSNQGLVGLGEIGSTLYGEAGGTLYLVNPLDGALTPVGAGSAALEVFGSTTTGLFGLDYNMNLYSISAATGASTLVGPTGLSLPSHNGLSSGSDSLFFTEEPNPLTGPASLYSLNTLTGAATLRGSNSAASAVFGPVFEYSDLYAASCGTGDGSCGFAPSPESIYILDPTNGAAAFAALSSAASVPVGMAPAAAPEPSTTVLVTVAVGMIGLSYPRRRKRHL